MCDDDLCILHQGLIYIDVDPQGTETVAVWWSYLDDRHVDSDLIVPQHSGRLCGGDRREVSLPVVDCLPHLCGSDDRQGIVPKAGGVVFIEELLVR